MNLFGFNKKTPAKGFKGTTILQDIRMKILEFVEVGKKDNSEVSDCAVLFLTDCTKNGMQPIFSAIGDKEGMITLLHYAALEDEQFGKILVTAVEAAIFKNKELASLQKTLKSSGGKVKKSLNIGSDEQIDLAKMSKEDMLALAKRLANRGDNDKQ